jgi:hypothetical protein
MMHAKKERILTRFEEMNMTRAIERHHRITYNEVGVAFHAADRAITVEANKSLRRLAAKTDRLAVTSTIVRQQLSRLSCHDFGMKPA